MNQATSLYIHRDSGLHRLHPLTKLVLVGLAFVAGLAVPGIWTGYLVTAGLVLPLSLWGKLAGELAGKTWRLVLPFAVSVFLVQGLFWTGGTPILEIGPASFKREGVLFALASTGRILAVVTSFLLLSISTRPDHLMTALSVRGLPASLSYIMLSALQLVPRFQARASSILDAQRARGLETEGNLLVRGRALFPLVAPLILGSLIEVDKRAIALESRAFNRSGPKTSLVSLPDSSIQRFVRVLVLFAIPLLVVGRLVLELLG